MIRGSIGDLVAQWERDDDQHRSALEEGRRWVADTFYGEDGDTVRTLRLRKGWSQARLAAELGTSQSHIARIERGTENLTIETCRKLSRALEIDLNTLDQALKRQEAIAQVQLEMIRRHIETLFCDDIRYEIGGKLSFIGVYSGELLAAEFLATLPKLCLFVKMVTPAEEPFRSLNLRVLKDAETVREIAFEEEQLTTLSDLAEGMTKEQREARVYINQAIATFSPMQFDEPCILRISVRTEDSELHGGALKVDQARRPTDSVSRQS